MSKISKLNDKPLKDPDAVLEIAKGQFQDVMIIGWDTEDGSLKVMTSDLDMAEVVYLVSIFKHKLLNLDYETTQR